MDRNADCCCVVLSEDVLTAEVQSATTDWFAREVSSLMLLENAEC